MVNIPICWYTICRGFVHPTFNAGLLPSTLRLKHLHYANTTKSLKFKLDLPESVCTGRSETRGRFLVKCAFSGEQFSRWHVLLVKYRRTIIKLPIGGRPSKGLKHRHVSRCETSIGHFCGERKRDPKFHQLLETTNDRGLKGHRLTWPFSLLRDYATWKIDGTTPTWPLLGHLLGVH